MCLSCPLWTVTAHTHFGNIRSGVVPLWVHLAFYESLHAVAALYWMVCMYLHLMLQGSQALGCSLVFAGVPVLRPYGGTLDWMMLEVCGHPVVLTQNRVQLYDFLWSSTQYAVPVIFISKLAINFSVPFCQRPERSEVGGVRGGARAPLRRGPGGEPPVGVRGRSPRSSEALQTFTSSNPSENYLFSA
jgi:hypothetical protein